ncbi:uncharacterized protein LOC124951147 [Vespa velutina]|uniref:uncharacterized protein LOC124951147 n=1 Tax=Vespa velutina TaxID=202808 RepID=UPI001FB3DB38|nr:uncharacterized protein LOC124951147 [Vespa velutina]
MEMRFLKEDEKEERRKRSRLSSKGSSSRFGRRERRKGGERGGEGETAAKENARVFKRRELSRRFTAHPCRPSRTRACVDLRLLNLCGYSPGGTTGFPSDEALRRKRQKIDSGTVPWTSGQSAKS